ncbi:hypothetical protein U14_05147 [Candidatus Moduliflexus flocculans]|uniref:Uncharacterized protein n=1 Tax=Candidatus Moduliflexus flocculans TaxID=1499966 RepID=A0A081BR41_9BACT|nr:hypothetical protein U14_05147 [Candidatus Moduliflexus flocculans]
MKTATAIRSIEIAEDILDSARLTIEESFTAAERSTMGSKRFWKLASRIHIERWRCV